MLPLSWEVGDRTSILRPLQFLFCQPIYKLYQAFLIERRQQLEGIMRILPDTYRFVVVGFLIHVYIVSFCIQKVKRVSKYSENFSKIFRETVFKVEGYIQWGLRFLPVWIGIQHFVCEWFIPGIQKILHVVPKMCYSFREFGKFFGCEIAAYVFWWAYLLRAD